MDDPTPACKAHSHTGITQRIGKAKHQGTASAKAMQRTFVLPSYC